MQFTMGYRRYRYISLRHHTMYGTVAHRNIPQHTGTQQRNGLVCNHRLGGTEHSTGSSRSRCHPNWNLGKGRPRCFNFYPSRVALPPVRPKRTQHPCNSEPLVHTGDRFPRLSASFASLKIPMVPGSTQTTWVYVKIGYTVYSPNSKFNKKHDANSLDLGMWDNVVKPSSILP